MYSQPSTIRRMEVAAFLAVCLTLPGVMWAAPPSSNPGRPFANGGDLRGVTQNWDKKLDSTNGDANGCNSDRFTCLFDDTAVRDNETGLVWERSVDLDTRDWASAIAHCANREVGGRKGWQLPMREQLASLVDTSNEDPSLPTGNPFQNVVFLNWSATTRVNNPTEAWGVNFFNGFVGFAPKGGTSLRTWCVRGGQSFDGQNLNALP